ncbi:heavy metal-binding domain-containing protein [Runella zeae]|uniref:heavy metal-binding domain-containing protein n=1 Tax=Runella zeae TaxID=94255 RepID=UPI000407D30A|nr:heavy metal-binding domain-containing protein [Runella zeae]
MLITTTNNIEGKKILQYIGLVNGEAIIGANLVKDFFAGVRDVVGGRSGAYEQGLREAKSIALKEMIEQAQRLGANAIIGVDLDYQTIGGNGSMLMVSANGTAIIFEEP